MILLFIAAGVFLVLSFWANQLLVKILPKYVYLFILFPGIVLHELAHSICAILTGTPVTEVNLFSATGGHVIHAKPRVPVVGQLVISFAPLAIGIVAIYFLIKLMPLTAGYQIHIPYSTFILPLPALNGSFHFIYILWIYLILSITLTLLPSKQDMLASIAGIVTSIFIIVLVYINGWLKIPQEINGFVWYINICMAILIAILLPIKLTIKRR